MATLQELMSEVLGETVSSGQTKTAGAAKPSTSEVDQVLENLGLQDSGAVKTASAEGTTKNGGSMSLAAIYEQIMGNTVPEGQVKEAAADGSVEGNDETTSFGELVGQYFNEAALPYFEKVAEDLESLAGKGEQPLAHATTGGSMTSALGAPKDPQLPMNHSASSGAHLQVAAGNSTPYSLAVKQKILKRFADQGIVGEQK